ncbi:MAG: hypothetical protein QY309_01490 [Cyclobacteriaceae bacterium]|nr:MAG: hypothetical protein QY309_01490 [Cyclobacteriaceae bacterium]
MLAISALANAQIKNLSLSFSGNYSLNGTKTKSNKLQFTQSDPATGFTVTTVNVGSLRESYSGRPGFDFNVRGQVYQFNNFFIETGIGINYSRFKRSIEVAALSGSQTVLVPGGTIGGNYGVIIGSPIGRDSLNRVIIGGQPGTLLEPDEKIGESSTLYLQIPVIIGRHFWNERFQVRAGLVMSALLRATEYKSGYSQYQYNQLPTLYTYKETSGEGFNNLLISASTEFTYSLTKQVGITTSLLHSFSGIYDEDNRPGGKARLTTVAFGVRYSLKH